MNIKEYQKTLNYQLAYNYMASNNQLKRLLDIYRIEKPNLKHYEIYIENLEVEHNHITIYYSFNNDYYLVIINNRIKLYNNNIKIYDATITQPIKKTNTIIYLINKYLKGVIYEN